MSSLLRIHLRPNEKIFINGAVLRVDRKVAIELLNNVQFLLETHVLQQQDATTPLRQLYFVVQSMIVEPQTASLAQSIYASYMPKLLATFQDRAIIDSLRDVDSLVSANRPFDALKVIRTLYGREEEILQSCSASGRAVSALAKEVA